MMKPNNTKRLSPTEVSATPNEIMQTMPKTFLFGSAVRATQEINRTATAVKA
jgi:hypothetical protein